MNRIPSPRQPRRHVIHPVVAALLAVLLIAVMVRNAGYRREMIITHDKERQYLAEIERLKDQLSSTVPPGLSEKERRRLEKKGLANPAEALKADLLKHPGLIPAEGVLGGTMAFSSENGMYILSDRWVLASFTDGHISGKMLLRFDVTAGGRIAWSVIDSYLE